MATYLLIGDENNPASIQAVATPQITIDAAYQKGLTEPCRICIKAMEKLNETKGD